MGALDGARGALLGHPFGQGGLPKGAIARPGGGAQALALTPPRDYRGRATAAIPTAGIILPTAAGGAEPYTYALTGLPAGLAFDASARQITGTPTAAGTETPSYTVTDDAGTTATETFDFPVVAENSAATRLDWDNRGYGLETRTLHLLFLVQSEADVGFSDENFWAKPPSLAADTGILIDDDGNELPDYSDMTFTQDGESIFIERILIRQGTDRVILYKSGAGTRHFGEFVREVLGPPTPDLYMRIGNDEQRIPYERAFRSDYQARRTNPDVGEFLREIDDGTRVLFAVASP